MFQILIEAGRRLIKEATFTKKKDTVRICLFNDILLWGNADGNKTKYKGHENIKQLELESLEEPSLKTPVTASYSSRLTSLAKIWC